jgi:flavin-dependent dehydrogenase
MPSAAELLIDRLTQASGTLDQVKQEYDVIVIGAGPAGSLVARELAKNSVNVLLLDKNIFPRAKVCGCCLSASALKTLQACGLEHLPKQLGAIPINQLHLGVGDCSVDLPLTDELAISRQLFDSALIDEAITAGAQFLPQAAAVVEQSDGQKLFVIVLSDQQTRVLSSRIVVVADGLGGVSTQNFPELAPIVATNARIGTGAVSEQAPSFYENGTIYMSYGAGGYLGLVRIEDGRTDVAAALDPAFLKSCGTAAAAAKELLTACHWPVPPDLDQLAWKGTVPLTRHRPAIAAHRLFLVGDAASYVEPFTGEGIAWAMQSALLLAPLVVQALKHFDETFIWRWEHIYRRSVVRAQRPTKMLAQVLGNPELASNATRLLSKTPMLAQRVARLLRGTTSKTLALCAGDPATDTRPQEVHECPQS